MPCSVWLFVVARGHEEQGGEGNHEHERGRVPPEGWLVLVLGVCFSLVGVVECVGSNVPRVDVWGGCLSWVGCLWWVGVG